MKYAFIQDNTRYFPVTAMCRVFQVSRSGYYDWRRRKPSSRHYKNAQLTAAIQRLHIAYRRAYGARKLHCALLEEGYYCGLNRVIRLRRAAQIITRRRQRFVLTTRSGERDWAAPNLLQRNFSAARPNQIWVTDVTFIPTREGWLYLAIMLDCYSRKVVGWAMSSRNNNDLVICALKMAIEHRQPAPGLIHHSDRGRLYASQSYRAMLADNGIQASMSRKGDCWDNAVAESFFGTLENELILAEPFSNREHARREVFRYIEGFYNRQRLHETLHYQSPEQFEALVV